MTAALAPVDKPLLRALRGERQARPPVWLMRQAGRYLPEYRAVRGDAGSFLDLCYNPALATEVTLQPIRRFGLDAAILFSDILVVPDGLGCDVRFLEGEGPKLGTIRDMAGLAKLDLARVLPHLAPVYEAVRRIRAALPADVALIGFGGAPWTLAAYVVEGGGSRDYTTPRAVARADPGFFQALIDLLTLASIEHLSAQILAGAEVVQLFDSWAGALAPEQRQRWCVEPAARIVEALNQRHPEVPVVLFPRGVGAAYTEFTNLGAAALAVDTTVSMAWAAAHVAAPCLQGNLDPAALLADIPTLLAEADRIVAATGQRAHVFNLGHGVVPQTPPDSVAALVAHLKS